MSELRLGREAGAVEPASRHDDGTAPRAARGSGDAGEVPKIRFGPPPGDGDPERSAHVASLARAVHEGRYAPDVEAVADALLRALESAGEPALG